MKVNDNYNQQQTALKKVENLMETSFKVNIIEKEEEYILICELPGFKREKIYIDVDKNKLIVSAKREEDENINYIRKEIINNNLKRIFDTKDVLVEDIKASFNEGILKIIMPKDKDFTSEKIRIAVETYNGI